MYQPYLDHEYSYDFVFFWPLNKRNADSDLFRPPNIINDYRILVILYFSTLLAYTRSLCTAYVYCTISCLQSLESIKRKTARYRICNCTIFIFRLSSHLTFFLTFESSKMNLSAKMKFSANTARILLSNCPNDNVSDFEDDSSSM